MLLFAGIWFFIPEPRRRAKDDQKHPAGPKGNPSLHIESGTGAGVAPPPDAEPLDELLAADDEPPTEVVPAVVLQYVGSSEQSWLRGQPWLPTPSSCCCWLVVVTCAATGDVAKSSAIVNANFTLNPSPNGGTARLATY